MGNRGNQSAKNPHRFRCSTGVIKQKDFLSIKEAYTLLGVSERTFYRLMKEGTIPATKLGGRTIIKRSIIDNLFAI
jgi:DNA binding domain, excisionase family